MTNQWDDEPAGDRSPSTAGVVLKTVRERLRRDPGLIVPFAIAGLIVAIADWFRQRDPIPAATPDSFDQTISVQFSVFPTGTARTVRHADALVDLRTPYLVGAVGLELVVVLAVGVAGWLTITRALDATRRLGSLGRYLGVLSAVALLSRVLEMPTIEVESVLLGLLVLITGAFVLVCLFLVPGFLAVGRPVVAALRESVRASRGRRWSLFWLVVCFGLVSWVLARIPIAGGLLSTAVVAPIHAVSLAVLIDEGRSETADRSHEA